MFKRYINRKKMNGKLKRDKQNHDCLYVRDSTNMEQKYQLLSTHANFTEIKRVIAHTVAVTLI